MSGYFIHSGIKGQKWGIRRFQNEDGTLTAEGKERYGGNSETRNKKPKAESSTWKSKDAGRLSDAELNRRNVRLQKEEQYRRMTQSRGQKAAKWIAKTAGVILVGSLVNALSNKMQNDVYKDAIGKTVKKYGPGAKTLIDKAKKNAAPYAAAAMLKVGKIH